MSPTIDKNDSMKVIRETIQKLVNKRNKKQIELDRYFGKVKFGIDGLQYQKKIRNEWK